jgi:tetratricopeptide (TPR) repeat protein
VRWLAIIAVLVLAPAPAAADKADALFTKGKQLLAKKKYAEACPTFEKVDELDPGIGAKLNVARCYQEWGKLARAHRWYSDAERMAKAARDDRAAKIRELLEALDLDVPRLTIRASDGADLDAAAITLDGEKLAANAVGDERRIDPGPHEIAYVVDGAKKTKTVAIERGGAREVTLELPKATAAKKKDKDKDKDDESKTQEPADPDGTDEHPPAPWGGRRIAGAVLMGAGAVSLGVSGYLAFDARGTYRRALDMHCMGQPNACNDEGLRITRDARSRANLGTVFALVGVAAAAGGAVLYLTARSSQPEDLSQSASLYIAPSVGPGAGFVVLGGRY